MIRNISCYLTLSILLFSLAFAPNSAGAATIDGPTCVVPGVSYQYTVYGLSSTVTRNWCVDAGYIPPGTTTTCRSGKMVTISVKFEAGYSSGSVSVSSTSGGASINVTIIGALNPGTLIGSGVSQSINYNTIPQSIYGVSASGASCSPIFTYSWESSPDQTNWTSIPNSNIAEFTPGPLTQTTYFRRFVSESNSSSSGYSNVATVFVYPDLQPGAVNPATQPTVSYNGTGMTLFSASVSGGNGSYAYQWQQSTDGGNTYTDIGGAVGTSYVPTNMIVTRHFRVAVTSNGVTKYSERGVVHVWPVLSTGPFSPASQTIAYNTVPSAISITDVTGGNGSYAYQWSFATVMGAEPNWQTIPGTTSATYSPGALTGTRWYKVEIMSAGGLLVVWGAVINVTPPLTPGSIAASAYVISYNTSPGQLTGVNPTGGNCSSYTYSWEQSVNGGSFTSIVNSNIANYTPGNLVVTTAFRRVASCALETVTSNAITISVNPQLFSGDLDATAIVTAPGTSPGLIGATVARGGNCSNYIYQWQSSPDNFTFTDISGATGQKYTPGPINVPTYFRRRVNCGIDSAFTQTCKINLGAVSLSDITYIKFRQIKKPGIVDINTAEALNDPAEVNQVTDYYSALGLPIQSVQRMASSTSKDIVGATGYDEFMRKNKQYLSYVSAATDGNYRINSQSELANFQTTQNPGENYFFEQLQYEASPLNRINKVIPPGNSWAGNGRGSTYEYFANTEFDSVRIWDVVDQGAISFATYQTPGYYPSGELYKQIVKDEHGKQVVEFKDKEGKIILKKIQLTASIDQGSGLGYAGWLCTYYLYDEFNRLRCVVQPEGVKLLSENGWSFSALAGEILAEQCFRYEYDGHGNLSMKKVPGAGEVWLVYDSDDKLVMTQDANLRSQNKWLYTMYDKMNRNVGTGLIDDAHDRAYHASLASNSSLYPDLSSSDHEVLTRCFYDDYEWLAEYGFPFSPTRNTTHDNYLHQTSAAWPYPQAIEQSKHIKGMMTGQLVRIPGTNQVLYNIAYYDEMGRIIQSQKTNITNGSDIATIQYSWSGIPLVRVEQVEKGGNNAKTYTIVTKLEYDVNGSVTKIWKNVNNDGTDHAVATTQYNETGQLVEKQLGDNLERLHYEYNVRGWLIGMNRSYLREASGNKFGFELGYDNANAIIDGSTYLSPQYTGNIAGMTWRSAGDGEKRKYDFSYDATHRLMKAEFTQYSGSDFNQSAGINFNVLMGDGTDPWSAYDANGNILRMQQWGLKGVTSSKLDDLVYTYKSHSNKIKNVVDGENDIQTKLGDFRSSAAYMNTLGGIKNNTSLDYDYDWNGNLIKDLNKDIEDATNAGIEYNHLNLPTLIRFKNKGSIEYVYDALGARLKKIVHETGSPDKSTLYLGSSVFQNDSLQFIGHEEGRVRYAKKYYTNGDSAYFFFYDYFIRDHLGNIRMVLTDQRDTALYFASMESAYRLKEETLFSNISKTSVSTASVPGGYPTDNTTTPNDSLAKVNGSANRIGPSLLLKVMSGDKIDLAVKSFYRSNGTTANNSAVNDVLMALADGIFTIAGNAKGTLAQLENTTTSPLLGGINSFRSSNNPDQPTKPKAYINWMLLDEQFNYVAASSGAIPVGVADAINLLAMTGINMAKNGFLYIYVSNETQNCDVFFDNLAIKHYIGPITEEAHYYPFGLTMAGISSNAHNRMENRYKYNKGSELQNREFADGSGLEIYVTPFRSLDPQLGRWWQLDPKPDFAQSMYSSMNNSPILLNDPLGDTVRHTFRTGFLGIFGKKVTVDYANGKYYNAGTTTEYVGKLRNYQKGLLGDLTTLSYNTVTSSMMGNLVNSTQVIQIKNGGSSENGGASFEAVSAVANPGKPLIVNYSVGKSFRSSEVNQGGSNVGIPSFVALAHEFAHVQDYLTNGSTNFLKSSKWYTSTIDGRDVARSEIFATDVENRLRGRLGLPLRQFYSADRSKGITEGQILSPGTRANVNYPTISTPPTPTPFGIIPLPVVY
jgi:hypothetical protein